MPIRKVQVSGSIFAEDHETFGSNERETQPVGGIAIVNTEGVGSELVKMQVGVGGEVRVELELDVSADSSQIAFVNGVARLFEGDDESTQDLEDDELIKISVLPNETRTHEVNLSSDGFGGGDKSKITLTFTNTKAELDLTSGSGSMPGGAVALAARHSGLVLDVAGGTSDHGSPLVQWPTHGGPNQQFRIEPVADGLVRLVAQHSGLVLDVTGGGTAGGEAVVQWPWHGGDNQRFRLEPAGDGYVQVVAVHSGMALDVTGASLDAGAAVVQWPSHGGHNQQWAV